VKGVIVHWLFKDEPTLEARHLCDVSASTRDAARSIVLRPVIRQPRGGGLCECVRCAAIGEELGIP
jgi:hypothetical protein